MKIEIYETERVKKTIEIDFPYYYTQYLPSEGGVNVIYGKITKDFVYIIHEKHTHEISFEIIKDVFNSGYSSYLKDECKSSLDEYESVKSRAKSFLLTFGE